MEKPSNQKSSALKTQELLSLHELARELLKLDDYDQMLDAVVQHSLESLAGERGFLVLKKGDGLDFKVVRNWSRDELEGPDGSRLAGVKRPAPGHTARTRRHRVVRALRHNW